MKRVEKLKRKFRQGDVVKLGDLLVDSAGFKPAYFRKKDDENKLKIIAGSRGIIVECNETKPLHEVACVELYDPSHKQMFLDDNVTGAPYSGTPFPRR